jgi:DNA-binding FrmR family transcriptional regulator
MGLLVEIMVSVLLAVTIWYCVSLDKRLKLFKADEESFRKIIMELAIAAKKAETAIPGLRIATAEAEQSLGTALKESESQLKALDRAMQNGEDVLQRIAQIVVANRAAEEAAEAALHKHAERLRVLAQPENPQPTDFSEKQRSERLSDAARAARELALKARDRKLAEAA